MYRPGVSRVQYTRVHGELRTYNETLTNRMDLSTGRLTGAPRLSTQSSTAAVSPSCFASAISEPGGDFIMLHFLRSCD
jgi:hypothetical protein